MKLRLETFLAFVILACGSAHAVELKVSAQALQRTLAAQLFVTDVAQPLKPGVAEAAAAGRFYLRGDGHSACYVYAESPTVAFSGDRIVVHLHIRARLGTSIRGECIGISLSREVDVSMVPEAEGESVGFRDARLDRLSGSRELDMILLPFLSRRVPSSMKINAADQLRKLFTRSEDAMGYALTLDTLKLHSMQVADDALVIDLDGNISVK